ncbi:MAG: hypothetical protein LQ346_004105 [Caloplaca aetnensis]|nr:MAG: hypothetical protein LQ346_004105 [Caloplaca aetnensis]
MSLESCRAIDDTFGPYAGYCRGGFDFTLLFEETLLSILPLCAVLSIAPWRIVYLLPRTVKVLYALISIFQVALIALWASPSAVRTRTSIPNAAVTLVGTLALGVLSFAEHQRTIRPSLILEAYLLLSLIFDAARVRTLWLQDYNNILAAVSTAAFAIKICLLSVETVGKRKLLRKEYASESPEATSGLFGKSLFLWLNPLFRTGYKHSISVADLIALDKHLTANYLYDRLHQPWANMTAKGPRSLLMLFFRRFKWRFLAAVPPRLGLIAFNFCQPFLIERVIEFNQQPATGSTTNVGYGLIGAYFLVYTGIAVTTGQYHHMTYRAITMARGGLVSMMFAKTPLVNANGADPASSLTLMSADIERITNGWQTMHECWANVIEVSVAIWLLERQLGAACAIPIGVAIGKAKGPRDLNLLEEAR